MLFRSRQDVAAAIGLEEPSLDRILIDLERLSIQAGREADEYWWLLKQPGKGQDVRRYRQAVFQRYEVIARKTIRGSLTKSQRAKWQKLAGPPIAGLQTRNHFG